MFSRIRSNRAFQAISGLGRRAGSLVARYPRATGIAGAGVLMAGLYGMNSESAYYDQMIRSGASPAQARAEVRKIRGS